MTRLLIGLACGLALGVVGVFLWLAWYLRDMFR